MDDAAVEGHISQVRTDGGNSDNAEMPSQPEYVQAEVWNEDCKCWVSGLIPTSSINALAQKREHKDDDDDLMQGQEKREN